MDKFTRTSVTNEKTQCEKLENNKNINESQNTTLAKPSFFTKLKLKTRNYFTYNIEGKRERVWELDLIRGILLFFVTIDHTFTFAYGWGLIPYKTAFGAFFKNFADFYLGSTFKKVSHLVALWLICFMSGTSCQFARSSLRRIIKFWIFTALFMGGYAVLHLLFPNYISGFLIFNIVAVLTLSMTFWYLLDHFNCPMSVRIITGSLLTAFGLGFYIYSAIQANGPFVEDIISNGAVVNNDFLALMVYSKNGYSLSPDNFEPLLPHLGFFFLGAVFGRYFYKDKTTRLKRKTPPKALMPIMILGKHSLAAYLVLTPIVIALIWLITRFVWLFL